MCRASARASPKNSRRKLCRKLLSTALYLADFDKSFRQETTELLRSLRLLLLPAPPNPNASLVNLSRWFEQEATEGTEEFLNLASGRETKPILLFLSLDSQRGA